MEENYFKVFFNNSPNAYSFLKVLKDKEGIPFDYEILEVNESCEKILCVETSGVTGKRVSEIFPVECKQVADEWNEIVLDLLSNNKTSKIDIPYPSLNKWIRFELFPINSYSIACIFYDTTKEYIQEKEKNEMMKTIKIQEEWLANISHELKTPLSVIFSQNQLLKLYLESGLYETNKEKILRGINIIKQNCYRLTKLINNIVDLSKIKAGFLELNLSNENIVEITEGIVQSVAEYVNGKGLNITFNTNTEEKIMACDPEKIERMMLNLISNAIKFTNPGGCIFVNLIDKGEAVEITVEDTGIGIEKKYLGKIFGKFQQVDKSLSRNAEGSGIGLSVVKSLVKMHRGKITVESEVGKGSIFKIELPVRTVENPKVMKKTERIDNRIQMINVEFSDIYSI